MIACKFWKLKNFINILKNSIEIFLCFGIMEFVDLINVNYRKLLGNICFGVS